MTITAEPEVSEAAGPGRRRRLGLWITLGVALVLVVAGAITATVWYRHYADAPTLVGNDTEMGFLPPDNAHSRFRTAGPFTADIAPVREGKRQGFIVWVDNPSSVTQTVLGVAHPSATNSSVTVGVRSPYARVDRFEHTPTDIPPHSTRALHYYVRITSCNDRGSGPGWTDISLRVRVGHFVRTQTLSLGGDFTYELLGTGASCT